MKPRSYPGAPRGFGAFAWAVLLAGLLTACSLDTYPKTEGWLKPEQKGLLIAHALGAIEGRTYTNSLEAFLQNYASGKRWFEVDLNLTLDGDLVCYHRGQDALIGLYGKRVDQITTADFLSRKFLGRFTLLSFEQLLELASERENVYIVTDTKGWDSRKSDALIRHLRNVNPALVSRLIPQIYRKQDLVDVVFKIQRELGKCASVILTLYMEHLPDGEVVQYVVETGIPLITMPTNRVNTGFLARLHDVGAYTFTHTLNSHDEIEKYRAMGIDGFYTDSYAYPVP